MARNVHAPQRVDDLPLFRPAPAPVRAERDRVLAAVEKKNGDGFGLAAAALIVSLLEENGRMSGEDLVSTCRDFGIVPATDDRAFGPVFATLSRAGRIEQVGHTDRAKGHGTAGGRVWALGGAR